MHIHNTHTYIHVYIYIYTHMSCLCCLRDPSGLAGVGGAPILYRSFLQDPSNFISICYINSTWFSHYSPDSKLIWRKTVLH